MSNIFKKAYFKIILYILCVVSFSMALLSGWLALIFESEDFYIETKQHLVEKYQYHLIISEANNIAEAEFLYNGGNYYNDTSYYSIGNTNLMYQIIDNNGNVVSDNLDGETVNDDEWRYIRPFWVNEDSVKIGYTIKAASDLENGYIIKLGVDESYYVSDKYKAVYDWVSFGYSLRYAVIPLFFVFASFVLVICVILIYNAGKKDETDNIYLSRISFIPYDLLILLCFICAIALIDFIISNGILIAVGIVLAFALLLGFSISISARIKKGVFLKNTITYLVLNVLVRFFKYIFGCLLKLFNNIKELFLNLPVVYNTAGIWLAITALETVLFMFNLWEADNLAIIFVIFKLIEFPIVLYFAIITKKIQYATKEIAGGNLHCKVDTQKLFGSFKKQAENLNNIANGVDIALENKIKSERTKTELITNVSHDIKTPLTSIINYSNLIAEEKCENENHTEYCKVLIKKSEHLKRLLEDIVEASKASTGNLEINLSRCEANVLLEQIEGEFNEAFENKKLRLVFNKPNNDIYLMVDSRRIWRVFENIMNNIYKYSLEGTRVYISVEKNENKIKFIFKNTSKEEMNINSEELFERFVRGDGSRTSEGSGLGLSIAKSLVELQNGNMDIVIDGDLFKVIIEFSAL